MEVKIHKMQSGGGVPSFTYYLPVMVNTATAQQVPTTTTTSSAYTTGSSGKSSDSDSSKGELTDKDLLEMLNKVDGLPNDMNILFKTMSRFYTLKDLPGGSSVTSLSNQYLSALLQVKTASFNKKEFDKSYNVANKNNALNEVAIDEQGRLIVTSDGKTLQKMSVSDYLNNLDKYLALTNSNVLDYRALSSDYAYDNTLFDVVNNGISMDNINKLIHSYITKLGTDELSTTTYEKRKALTILNGVSNLQQAYDEGADVSESGVDGLYKTKKLTKTQATLSQNALVYLYNMLPKNAKSLLLYKTGSEENALKLLSAFITSGVSSTNLVEDTLVLDAEGKKLGSKSSTSSGTGGKSSDRTDEDPVKGFILGEGYLEPITINTGNSINMQLNGRFSVLTSQGKELAANSTFNDLLGSDFKSVLDTSNATMGGIRIDGDKNKLILSDADIIRVDMPVDTEYQDLTGIIRPDYNLTLKMEDAEDEVAQSGLTDPEKINEIYKNHGLPDKFVNKNGGYSLNTLNYKSFAMINAKAEESAFADPDLLNQNMINKMDNDNAITELENVFKSQDKSYSRGGWGFLGGGKDFYQGYLFIPIRDSLIAAAYGSGDYYKLQGNNGYEIAEKEQLNKLFNKAPSLDSLK